MIFSFDISASVVVEPFGRSSDRPSEDEKILFKFGNENRWPRDEKKLGDLRRNETGPKLNIGISSVATKPTTNRR